MWYENDIIIMGAYMYEYNLGSPKINIIIRGYMCILRSKPKQFIWMFLNLRN